MFEKQDFTGVKVGDQLLVERSQYSSRGYYTGTVTKVTGTRFTVSAICFGQGHQVFTKDGSEYPRSTGYGRTYVHLKLMTDEGKILIKKYLMANKAQKLAGQLSEMFSSSSFRDNIASIDLDHKDLDGSINLLEDVIKRFSAYAKEKR